jgi:hypothetical protein
MSSEPIGQSARPEVGTGPIRPDAADVSTAVGHVLAIGLFACWAQGTESGMATALLLGGGSLVSLGLLVPRLRPGAAGLVAGDLAFVSVETVRMLACLQTGPLGAAVVLAAAAGACVPLAVRWRRRPVPLGCGIRVLGCFLLSAAVLTAKWFLWPAYSCVLWASPLHMVWRVYLESGLSGGRFLVLVWAVWVVSYLATPRVCSYHLRHVCQMVGGA